MPDLCFISRERFRRPIPTRNFLIATATPLTDCAVLLDFERNERDESRVVADPVEILNPGANNQMGISRAMGKRSSIYLVHGLVRSVEGDGHAQL